MRQPDEGCRFWLFRNCGIHINRAVVCEDYHAGFCARGLFDVLYLYIIDRDIFRSARLAVISGNRSGFPNRLLVKLGAATLDDDMRARNIFGVKPKVFVSRGFKG